MNLFVISYQSFVIVYMDIQNSLSHPWSISFEKAKQIQQRLSEKVVRKDDLEKLEKIMGVGVVFSKSQDEFFVGCVSFLFPELEMVNAISQKQKVSFPYTPGFFAFSTGPAILSAIKKIERPDLIIFPGRGIAHPRKLGLASHLGLLLDIPTIACSKTPLWRDYPEPSSKKEAHVFVQGVKGELIGAVVRTKENVNPIFVTPGHRISTETAVKIVLECSPRYRIPEPLRQAQILTKKMAENR